MNNVRKVLIQEKEHVIINKEGEVYAEISEKLFNIPSEPPFVKLYVQDIVKLNNLPKGNSGVLYELIKVVDYQNEINLNPRIKQRICSILNIKPSSLNNAISKLLKKNIICRLGRGSYFLNPNLFAKGSWSDIRKMRDKYLNLTITYKDGEKTMSSSFSDEPQP